MSQAPVLTVLLRAEHDVVFARQRARELAHLLGLDAHDQTRIATAVSEIARNAQRYAGGGRVEFSVEARTGDAILRVRVIDDGPGIPHLDQVLAGRYRSTTGQGEGIRGARRLMDTFDIRAAAGHGTEVTLGKFLPRAAVTHEQVAGAAEELARARLESPLEELRLQNQELMRALDQLRSRQEDLARLNSELEDTNRGVVALYAELDEKAESLRRASEVKSRFLSNMSHEFRTPLNAIRSLTGLLLDRVDGDLSSEQQKQVRFIRRSAEELTELVDDLLDIAKVEAGKIDVRATEFGVHDLFGALRAMLRPLVADRPEVTLVFDDASGLPPLLTDEGKLSQILRNLISNALKYTERGEVRVAATAAPGGCVAFSVSDTGIGIPVEHLERIFEEFEQVENPLQKRAKGTGLGLPLSRRLAGLLGGRLSVESVLGAGSTFTLTLPTRLAASGRAAEKASSLTLGAGGTLLIVDDDEIARYVARDLIGECAYAVVEAAGGEEGLRLARELGPRAIVLDLAMPGMSGQEVLGALRADPSTRGIPVVVYTSLDLDDASLGELEAAGAVVVSKASSSRSEAAASLWGALAAAGLGPHEVRGGHD